MKQYKIPENMVFTSENKDEEMGMIEGLNIDEEKVPKGDLGSLPILTLRNMVMFPNVVMPITVGRPATQQLIADAEEGEKFIGVFCQKDMDTEHPGFSDLHHTGVIAKILRVFEMPGSSTSTVILQSSFEKIHLNEINTVDPYLRGHVSMLDELREYDETDEFTALADTVRELAQQLVDTSEEMTPDTSFPLRNLEDIYILTSFICTNFPFDIDEKIDMLRASTLTERMYKLISALNREIKLAGIKRDIHNRTQEDIDKQQKEYFLQQQIKNIQDELGGGSSDDILELRKKAKKKNWGKNMDTLFEKEILKLERINSQSPDYNIQLTYLQTLIDLPWNKFTKDSHNIKRAEKVLDHDHYGLDKVKERILEHLAVLQLKKDMKSPIICLYGPPGVGKTSLGKSIAAALERKYVRMSLGGVHDEAEIRGHRRTYIGAMPGRIIKSLIRAGSSNPVIILDEIDKLSSDHRGDPASAMLEVLDPEQNKAFHDNYIDVDYDLSNILFIATANTLQTIPGPLLDRMELIEVSGYITEEKIEIAKRHLIPKELENNGLTKDDISINKKALEKIIEDYTRESGVRQLEKTIGKIMRKIALKIARDGREEIFKIGPDQLREHLGAAPYSRDKYQGNDYAGVVTGLAWTQVGGEILFIETSLSRGRGSKLTLTGNLGDVMKESAMLALEYLKAHADELDIDEKIFDLWNIHVHVPEGAIPKDGPSAGVTMATSLASALTQRKVKANLAMTGEITLRGRVLPVGGIKEKILAAKRAGIKDIMLSVENQKDIEEIKPVYLKGLNFHYVSDVSQVLDYALLKQKVENAIDFKKIIKEEEKENKKK